MVLAEIPRFFNKFSFIPYKKTDQSCLEILFLESLDKVIYLGFVLLIAYVHSVQLDYQLHNIPNLYLATGQLIGTILLFTAYFLRKKSLKLAVWLLRLSMLSIVILEIETGFHEEGIPYHDPRNYLTIVALLGVWSFFYPGKPSRFVSVWTLILILYWIRIIAEEGEMPIQVVKDMSTVVPLYLFFFFINYWWFWTRYTSAYRGMLLDLKHRNFIRDIHDESGSILTDLNLYVNQLRIGDAITFDIKKNLSDLSSNSLQSLRNQIYRSEDEDLIRKNFWDGIRIILGRRYSIIGRRVKFSIDSKSKDILARSIPEERVTQLKSLFMEITSNDLRYGIGDSKWQIQVIEDYLVFIFLSSSKDQNKLHDGLGTKSIKSRVESLGGTIETINKNFSVKISLPIVN